MNDDLPLNLLSERPIYWKICFSKFIIIYNDVEYFPSLFKSNRIIYKKSTYERSAPMIESLKLNQRRYGGEIEQRFELQIFMYDIINNQASTSYILNKYLGHWMNEDSSMTKYCRDYFSIDILSCVECFINNQWTIYYIKF